VGFLVRDLEDHGAPSLTVGIGEPLYGILSKCCLPEKLTDPDRPAAGGSMICGIFGYAKNHFSKKVQMEQLFRSILKKQ